MSSLEIYRQAFHYCKSVCKSAIPCKFSERYHYTFELSRHKTISAFHVCRLCCSYLSNVGGWKGRTHILPNHSQNIIAKGIHELQIKCLSIFCLCIRYVRINAFSDSYFVVLLFRFHYTKAELLVELYCAFIINLK